jgi:hypothetical protein
VLAETLTQRGLRIVSGRTESHVMLVDLRPKDSTGKEAEALLQQAHMTCNKNGIPNDPQKPMVTSGIRLGTPAMTTRGFKEEQARATAHLIADVLDEPARRGEHRRGAHQGRGADARLPGLPLSARGAGTACVAPSAATRTRRSSRPASPTRATSSVGVVAAELRQALHHLRAGRDRAAVGGEEGRHTRRVRPRQDPRLDDAGAAQAAVSVEQIDAAIERIQDKLLNSGAREVPSTRLGELVMRELKRIDKVAYVRFASVYRSFEDVDEFRQLIRDI